MVGGLARGLGGWATGRCWPSRYRPGRSSIAKLPGDGVVFEATLTRRHLCRDSWFAGAGVCPRIATQTFARVERARVMAQEDTFPDLPNELWIHVLVQGGPALLSSCSCLCKQLHQGISESSELHRFYAQECFGVTDCVREAHTDWREALVQCCKQWRSRPALPAWAGGFLSITPRSPYQIDASHPSHLDSPLDTLPGVVAPLRAPSPLAASVVAHTDQAGEIEAYGFPADNALSHNGILRQCWCTSTTHDRNVGLLVR